MLHVICPLRSHLLDDGVSSSYMNAAEQNAAEQVGTLVGLAAVAIWVTACNQPLPNIMASHGHDLPKWWEVAGCKWSPT
jgi:hypothetical protein